MAKMKEQPPNADTLKEPEAARKKNVLTPREREPAPTTRLRLRRGQAPELLPSVASSPAVSNEPERPHGDEEAPVSEYERYMTKLRPLLLGLNLRELGEQDVEKVVELLASGTGIERPHMAWLVRATQLASEPKECDSPEHAEVRQSSPPAQTSARRKVQAEKRTQHRPRITAEVYYGWFRQGLPVELPGLWSRSKDKLIATLKGSIALNIVPQRLAKQIEAIGSALDEVLVDWLLEPAGHQQAGSLGDLLSTMPRRLSPAKERIVAAAIRDQAETGADFVKRLKKHKLNDKEIAAVQVTRDLGEMTGNHPALVRELQGLRADDADESLRFLASCTPLQWLELAVKHGAPASNSVGPELYAERLERAVEAKYPTAVFASRVKSGRLELNDPVIETAATFLASHPELELKGQNARQFVQSKAKSHTAAQKEQLIKGLQGIQRIQKLTRNWQEAGALLNVGIKSSLDLVQGGRVALAKTVGDRISIERANDLYTYAFNVHDTIIALLANTHLMLSLRTFEVFQPSDDSVVPNLDGYPNVRTLFGNLATCACDHCQSVLSPAAYLIDLMRFLDTSGGGNGTGTSGPLSVLLARRPDIADLKLTCANSGTEVPYIDLVMEILENAIAFPMVIAPPYGFDPQSDLSRKPLPDSVKTALSPVLERTAISVGTDVMVRAAGTGTSNDWIVTDGAKDWVLRHFPESLTAERMGVISTRLVVTDFAQALAALDQGRLPHVEWVIPQNGSIWDKNLPLKNEPAVTRLKADRKKWKVQYTRAVRVEVHTSGSREVILKTAQGRKLTASQSSIGILERLIVALKAGRLAEPLVSMLPTNLQYQITWAGSEWEIAATGETMLVYVPERLEIASLVYQSSDSRDDLQATPENRNPEAYWKLDDAVYPWTLPFNLWLEEVRVFLKQRGVSRLQLISQCNPSGVGEDVAARERLGLSLSEASIITSLAARQPWEYWGLKQNGNSVKDLNDEKSLATGPWTDVLSKSVSILLQQSGLEFRELLNVLQTHFVRKEAPSLVPSGDECNPSKMVLTGLSSAHLDRIHRLVRLWRKLGWSVFDLDLAIVAVGSSAMNLNTASLRALARVARLQELLGLPISTIAAWWGGLATSYRDHTSDKRPVVKSIYERLFLNPTIANPPDPDFVLNKQGTELSRSTPGVRPTLASKAAVVIAALGITSADFEELVGDMLTRQELDNPPTLTLGNLSSLFRRISLAGALRLSIQAYLRLRTLTALDPFAGPAEAVDFVERAQYVAKSGFSIEELHYLLRLTPDVQPIPLFTAASAAQTLGNLRSTLQNVRNEFLASAEPIAQQLRKALARIGWYDELVEEAVDLLVAGGRLEVRIQGKPPAAAAVKIPAQLRSRVVYRAEDGALTGSASLTAAELTSLRTANNNATQPVQNAVDDLRVKIIAFAATLPGHQCRMQSIELPTFSVPYAPQTPPVIPKALSARCFFDPSVRQIAFTGWMTSAQQAQLKDSLPTTEATVADDLKKLSDQYIEQAQPNRFLFDLDELKALFAAHKTPDDRGRELIGKLLPAVYQKALVEGLSQEFDLDEALMDRLLSHHLDRASTLDALLDPQLIDSDDRTVPSFSAFSAQYRALYKLHKAALICRTLRIRPAELQWLPPASVLPRVFGVFELDKLPARKEDNAISFDEWRKFTQLFELRDHNQFGQTLASELQQLLNVGALTDLEADADKQHAKLAQVTGSPVEDVTWAAKERLKLQWSTDYRNATKVAKLVELLFAARLARAVQVLPQDAADAAERLNLTWPADYQNPAKLTALLELLLTVQRLGAKASDIFSLAEDVAPLGTTEAKPGKAEAKLARNLLRARYDEKSWPGQLKPIVDVLRERQCSSLVSYLITRPPENAVNMGLWTGSNDLYEHYLIDTQMGPCRVSTRVLHAISAVQLFVQRCLMNLEKDVSPAAIDVERWKWMKNYRVWEANRKVFLYPENWIEPELRDDKSELFEELEGQLLQNEFDSEKAEELLKQYLKQLEDVSHLAILGMYVDKPTTPDGLPTGETHIHIVGRTRNRPSRFFYRRWILSRTANYWTPWEHAALDGVKTDHILPFVLRGDVYIAWPEITQLASEAGTGENKSPGTTWRLQMSWIRRTSRGWSDRYVGQDPIDHPWVYGRDENTTFTFRVRPSDPDSIAIDCYGASREGDISYNVIDSDGPTWRVKDDALSEYSPPVNVQIFGSVYGSYSNNKVFAPLEGVQVKVFHEFEGSGMVQAQAHFDWEKAKFSATEDKRFETIKPLGFTNKSGTFSITMDLYPKLFSEEDYDEIRDCSRFVVEITVPADPSNVLKPFTKRYSYLATGDQHTGATNDTKYSHLTFLPTFVVAREGNPPGQDVERPVPMKQISQFKLLATEDAETISLKQGDLLPPRNETITFASGFRATKATKPPDLPGDGASNSVALWQTVAPQYFVLPAFPAAPQPTELVIYSDKNNTYFVRKQVDPVDPIEAQGKYQVLLDGHPRAGELRRRLVLYGAPALFNLENQQKDKESVLFGGRNPGNLIDQKRSLLQADMRFEPDDARSPVASYNTELFFHVPFLIATFLTSSQRFEEAQQWFHFIFNPTSDDVAKGNKRYWKYLPFREHSETIPIEELLKILGDPHVAATDPVKKDVTTQIDVWLKHPFRPHAVAQMRPRAYQFAVVFKYLDNLFAWGDQLYRQYTTESINEATQLYILAAKLLGPRLPIIPRRTKPAPLTYRSVTGDWDRFSNGWVELEANLTLPAGNSGSSGSGANPEDKGTTSLSSIGMLYFCIPGNEKMSEYWERVEKRLFYIRHCRNIDGVEQEVPPWQPPIDPGLLVRATAAGLDIGAVLSEVNAPLPYYRFGTMAQKAFELCGEVKTLGGALLSALEKKDAEQLSRLRSSQELELLTLVKAVREQQIDEANASIDALRQSEQSAGLRFAQYQRLLGKASASVPDDATEDIAQTSSVKAAGSGVSGELSGLGLTQAEQDQIDWSEVALRYGITAGILNTVSGIGYAIPSTTAGTAFLGLTYGGLHLGSVLNAGASFFGTLERNATHQATRSATIGQYQRRQDEWVFQSRLALKEVQQIRKQIIAAEIRRDIASKELKNHQQQIKNAKETDRFMREKYTNLELYQWMVQQIASVYFRSYQLAYDVAKRAERAFRFELGLAESNYVQPGYWDSLKKGLLAGEKLGHDLKRMEVAYLDQNKREYEITKHVSVLSLDPKALIALRQTGTCEITIPEAAFDFDYPGHYLRRIKSVGITIPCVTGPYTGVNCTLTLLKSSMRNGTGLSGGYRRDDNPDSDPRFTDSFGSIQSIVTSSGQGDSGLFETSLRDERYLPFEGAGVVESTWRLEMPSELRQFNYETISDVILHVRYTAREGGRDLKDAAAADLSQRIAAAEAAGMVRLFSVRDEFPSAWATFKSVKIIAGAGNTAELSLALRPEQYPFWSQGRLGLVEQAKVIARISGGLENVVIWEKHDGTGKTDSLKASSLEGFLEGELKNLKPASPVFERDKPLQLFFTQNVMDDLWIAITWKSGP